MKKVLTIALVCFLANCSFFSSSTPDESANTVANANETGDSAGKKTKAKVVMTDGTLTLRDAPGVTTGKRIARIPNGAEIMVGLCQNEELEIGGRKGRWCEASYKDQSGWVFDAWLVKEGAAGRTDAAPENKPGTLITANSAGPLRLGMTVGEARKALSDAKFTRSTSCAGILEISVSEGKKVIMVLDAVEGSGLDDDNKPVVKKIDENAKISEIAVLDSRYRTAEGVHPGMTVEQVEKKYGKVFLTASAYDDCEVESATFADQPKYDFGIDTNDGFGGKYESRRETAKYTPGTRISSINIDQ